MVRAEREERFPPNVQMGIIVVITTLIYLFYALTGQKIMTHSLFYLPMFFGAILGAWLIFGKDAGDKLHFTTKYVPMVNVLFYGVVLGLMLVTIQQISSGGTFFIQNSTEPVDTLQKTFTGFPSLLSGIVFIGLFSFITANSEETLTRGFFNSLAENYSDNRTTMNISKYILIPLIFSLLHFFMWTSTGLLNLGGIVPIFLILYHFGFGITCQFSMDITGSIYTPIAIHTVYNSVTMIIAIGIVSVGGF